MLMAPTRQQNRSDGDSVRFPMVLNYELPRSLTHNIPVSFSSDVGFMITDTGGNLPYERYHKYDPLSQHYERDACSIQFMIIISNSRPRSSPLAAISPTLATKTIQTTRSSTHHRTA